MKIVIPVADGKLCMHFGHCQTFALVEVNKETKDIINVENLTPPPHEPGVLPKWLHEQGANIIIAGGMGMRAQQIFNEFNVDVIVGAQAADPETVVRQWLTGTLTTGANVCDH